MEDSRDFNLRPIQGNLANAIREYYEEGSLDFISGILGFLEGDDYLAESNALKAELERKGLDPELRKEIAGLLVHLTDSSEAIEVFKMIVNCGLFFVEEILESKYPGRGLEIFIGNYIQEAKRLPKSIGENLVSVAEYLITIMEESQAQSIQWQLARAISNFDDDESFDFIKATLGLDPGNLTLPQELKKNLSDVGLSHVLDNSIAELAIYFDRNPRAIEVFKMILAAVNGDFSIAKVILSKYSNESLEGIISDCYESSKEVPTEEKKDLVLMAKYLLEVRGRRAKMNSGFEEMITRFLLSDQLEYPSAQAILAEAIAYSTDIKSFAVFKHLTTKINLACEELLIKSAIPELKMAVENLVSGMEDDESKLAVFCAVMDSDLALLRNLVVSMDEVILLRAAEKCEGSESGASTYLQDIITEKRAIRVVPFHEEDEEEFITGLHENYIPHIINVVNHAAYKTYTESIVGPKFEVTSKDFKEALETIISYAAYDDDVAFFAANVFRDERFARELFSLDSISLAQIKAKCLQANNEKGSDAVVYIYKLTGELLDQKNAKQASLSRGSALLASEEDSVKPSSKAKKYDSTIVARNTYEALVGGAKRPSVQSQFFSGRTDLPSRAELARSAKVMMPESRSSLVTMAGAGRGVGAPFAQVTMPEGRLSGGHLPNPKLAIMPSDDSPKDPARDVENPSSDVLKKDTLSK